MLSARNTPISDRRAKAARPARSSLMQAMTFLALLATILTNVLLVQTVNAASGDFSIDFVASAPQSYNHLIGGGAYDDRTIGVDQDVVESLEGGDFACGNIVTYFAAVTVANTVQAQTDAPQTIELDFSFLADTTGQSGIGLGDIVAVSVNRGTIEDLIAGEDTIDSGNVEDGGSVATLIAESLTGPLFQSGSKLLGTVQLTDLERAEQVVVRIDVKLFCEPGSSPTGNLQGDLAAARLTYINNNVPVSPPQAISGGAQTIPFKQLGNVAFPAIEVVKTVATANGNCPGTDSLVVSAGATVKYCYVVTNPSNTTDPPGAPLYNVSLTDDNGTPGNSADDFAVTLSGLTDEDNDGTADDLAAGGIATGYALVTTPLATVTIVNTATATGYDAIILPTPYTDTDTATVRATFAPVPAIDVEKYVSVDNGMTWHDADTAPGVYLPQGISPQFKFVVTNNGNVVLSDITLSDSDFDLSTCSIESPLAVYDSFECIVAGPWTLGQHTNTATAIGAYEGMSVVDSDDANYFGVVPPDISVVKTANPESMPEPGGSVTFSILVENHSISAVNLTSLFDDIYGDVLDLTDEAGTAHVQVSTTCSLPQSLAASDGQAGGADEYSCEFVAEVAGNSGDTETDTVTATASNEAGTDTAYDSATVALTDVLPEITVTKTANPTSVPETGGDVTFTFVVENTGVEAVTLTSLTDSVFGDLNGQGTCVTGGIIPVGGSYSCALTIFLISDSPTAHYNVVTAVGTDDDGSTATDTDDETVTFTDVLPEISVTKTANPTSVPETGGDVEFIFAVSNNSAESVTITSLTDDKFGTLAGDADCKVGTSLAAGASCEFSATFFVPAGDVPGSHVNIFTAVAKDNEGNSVNDSDDATVTYFDVLPGIIVEKVANPTSVPETGGDVVFTFVVENIGPETVTLTSLTDSVFGDLNGQGSCVIGGLIPVGGSYSCSITKFLSSDTLAPHVNVVTAVAADDEGNTSTDTDDETVTFTDVSFALALTKNVAHTSYSQVGEVLIYTLVAENIGEGTLHNVTISDPMLGELTCQPVQPATLQPGDKLVCEGSYAVTQGDLDAGHVLNTAVADSEETAPVEDSETLPAVLNPALTLVKHGDAGPVTIGDMVHYTITVKNTGNVTLHNVIVTDAKLGLNQVVGTLAVGQQAVITGTYGPVTEADLPGPIFNTAIGTGATPEEKPVGPITGTHEVPLVIAPKLTLVKTASPATYSEVGDVINYSYELTNAGNVTLYAPFKVSDNKTTVTCPAQPATLAPGESITCSATYVITEADVDAEAVTNVAHGNAKDPQGGEVTSNEDEETVTYLLTPTNLPPVEQPNVSGKEELFLPTLKQQ